MAANNQPAQRMVFVEGQRVGYSDFLREMLANKQQIGKGIAAQQGSPNALPLASTTITPLSVTTNGTMVVSLGGNGEFVFCDGWECDACPLQQYTVPANTSGSPRKDLIAIQYAQVATGTESTIDESSSGTQSSVSESLASDGVAYMYVQGDSTGNAPSAPPGYNAFATIEVVSGATAINAAQIAYLFPTMNPTGAKGDTGDAGATGPSPNPRGAWSMSGTYNPLDIVLYQGSSWIVPLGATPTAGSPPSSSNAAWMQLAQVGPQGPAGTNGTNGTNGSNGTNGQNGQNGQQGPPPETTTLLLGQVPAVGAVATFSVARPDALPFGQYAVISDGTNAFFAQVSAPGFQLGIRCLLQIAGATGAQIAAGATVAPAGYPGPQGTQGPKGDAGASIGTGSAGSSNSAIFTVGIVPLYKRVNYGTNEAGKSPSSDNSYPGDFGYLGATQFTGAFDQASTIEISVRMQVKAGAGAIEIGGTVLTNGAFAVFVDSTLAYDNTGTPYAQGWSASVPDDGLYHTVTLHFNRNGQIVADIGRWIPPSSGGGVSSAKFAYVGD